MKDLIGMYVINNPIFWICILIIGVIIISFKELRSNTDIKRALNRLPKDKYMILKNVVLSSNRKNHKIDNIIISKYGIFVIKYVYLSGKIYGDERENEWIQLKNNSKNYFPNPVKENNSSIRVLASLLDLNEKYFISIICFTEDVVLSCDTKDKVTQVVFLDDCVKSYRKEIIKYGLKEIRDKIKNSISLDNVDDSSNVCPKCGGKLVVRNGKFGDFLGCSNYPNCKYTKEL